MKGSVFYFLGAIPHIGGMRNTVANIWVTFCCCDFLPVELSQNGTSILPESDSNDGKISVKICQAKLRKNRGRARAKICLHYFCTLQFYTTRIIMLVKSTFLVRFHLSCPPVAAQYSQRIVCGHMSCNGLFFSHKTFWNDDMITAVMYTI